VWLRGGRYVSADDAYVHAAKLMVTTDVSGLVTSVDVKEGEFVKAGQVLFRVDPQQFQIALDNSKAQLAQTALSIAAMKQDYRRMQEDIKAQQAQVALDQSNYDRYAVLVRTDTVSRANYDQARYALAADQRKLESLKNQAQVQLARLAGDPDIPVAEHPQYRQAQAAVDEAQRQLDHSVIYAPYTGIATMVESVQPGMYLTAGTAAFGIVSTERVWIEANPKETELTWVKPGDPVSVAVDTYPGRTWQGRVESIAPNSGSEFSVLPAQNSSGNWVKVVQRIQVRISVDRQPDDPALRSGMSVEATIDTGHQRQLADLL
jgi:membrane fusion protein (multidrug efflux system)